MIKNFSIFKNNKKLPNTPFPDYEISVNLGTKDEVWNHYIGLAQQMMDETDPNGKWQGVRL